MSEERNRAKLNIRTVKPKHLLNLLWKGILKLGVTKNMCDFQYLGVIKAGNDMKRNVLTKLKLSSFWKG